MLDKLGKPELEPTQVIEFGGTTYNLKTEMVMPSQESWKESIF